VRDAASHVVAVLLAQPFHVLRRLDIVSELVVHASAVKGRLGAEDRVVDQDAVDTIVLVRLLQRSLQVARLNFF